MPPMAASCSYELGFSSNLMSTVAACRETVEQWAEREKTKADEMEASYAETLSTEQTKVDSLVSELLAVQFQLGVNVKNPQNANGVATSTPKGIAQRQQTLEKKRQEILEEIQHLKDEQEEKTQRVKGSFLHMKSVRCCRVIHVFCS